MHQDQEGNHVRAFPCFDHLASSHTAVYEGLLKDYCDFSKELDGIGDSLIGAQCSCLVD
jgi:hypothetical protein